MTQYIDVISFGKTNPLVLFGWQSSRDWFEWIRNKSRFTWHRYNRIKRASFFFHFLFVLNRIFECFIVVILLFRSWDIVVERFWFEWKIGWCDWRIRSMRKNIALLLDVNDHPMQFLSNDEMNWQSLKSNKEDLPATMLVPFKSQYSIRWEEFWNCRMESTWIGIECN